MNRLLLFYLILQLNLCATTLAIGQENRFKPGENLQYDVSYHLMGVWVPAGQVSFTVEQSNFRGKDCFKFRGFGKTYKRYDWFYKVRDTYESYASPDGLAPYRFRRDVSEGDFYFVEDVIFNPKDQNIFSVLKVKEREVKVDTSDYEEGSFDVLSMIYHARNLDFESFDVGDKIPIKMFIDRETFELFIRYLGTEIYEHKEYGEVECFVFSPLLVEGTLFKEGERMKVYVTRDSNVIPIYVESEIRVGSIRARLIWHEGLMAPIGQ